MAYPLLKDIFQIGPELQATVEVRLDEIDGDNIYYDGWLSFSGKGNMYNDASDFVYKYSTIDNGAPYNKIPTPTWHSGTESIVDRVNHDINISPGITSIANNFLNIPVYHTAIRIKGESILINGDVEYIGDGAFNNFYRKKVLIVNNRIKSIPDGCFSRNILLEQINLPINIESIGKSAFSECSKLENIILPSNLKNIGDNAFSSCLSLNNIIVPDSIINLGTSIFSSCASLKNIELPNNLTVIPDYTFSNSGLEGIKLPDSLTTIKQFAFQNCPLKEIHFPNSIVDIDGFYKCNSLEIIEIPSNVTVRMYTSTFYVEKNEGINVDINGYLITTLNIGTGRKVLIGDSELDLEDEFTANNYLFETIYNRIVTYKNLNKGLTLYISHLGQWLQVGVYDANNGNIALVDNKDLHWIKALEQHNKKQLPVFVAHNKKWLQIQY